MKCGPIVRRPKERHQRWFECLCCKYHRRWPCRLVTIDHLAGAQRCIV